MKVLLTEDVESLGSAGDIVEVADGFARNYLIPRNLAVRATSRAVQTVDELRTRAARARAEKDTSDRDLLASLEGVTCNLRAAADENGHLYGSITDREIAAELEQMGISIDRRNLLLEQHIKTLGEFSVPVRLSQDRSGEIRVVVSPE